MLGLFGLAGSLSAQTTTSTTLAVTNTSDDTVSSVSSGTVVVLTATVKTSSNGNVTAGTVNFCDATATYCEDAHLAGSAQLRSNGTAIYKFRPAPGAHSYYAKFVGTTSDGTSSSGNASLTVTGGPFSTTTSIAQSGSAGNYTLTGTVTSGGGTLPSPTGTLDFIDTSNGNYVLGTSTLTPGATSLTYASPISSTATSGTDAIYSVMADFNQDGIPDIALIEVNGDNNLDGENVVDIYFGNADGTFTKQTPIELLNGVPTSIAVGDLNGDGYPDLVLSGGGGLYVILNNGSGGFNAPGYYNLAYTDWSGYVAAQDVGPILVADINHDGHMDVVFGFTDFDPQTATYPNVSISGSYAGYLGVALGNGDGTLRLSGAPPYVSVYGTESGNIVDIALADLTGNGNLDLITTGDSYYSCVLPGNGDGTFQNASIGGGSSGSTCFSTSGLLGDNLVVADFNGDGKPDLALDNIGGNKVAIVLGNGDRTFQDPLNSGGNLASIYQVGSGSNGLVAADFNGDGIPDVATANSTDGTVTVMLGNGDGTFQAPLVLGDGSTNSQTALTFPAGDSPFWIQAGDFTGSGVPTIAVTSEFGSVVNTMVGSATTTATATVTGISPVGAATASDSVVASYEGDDYYTDSTSSSTSLNDVPVNTTLALQSSTSSTTVGDQVTLTATLSPTAAQGYSVNGESVTFYNNGTSVGTAPLSGGVAVLHLTLGVAQTYTFTASYPGDNNFVTSSTPSPVTVTVQAASTALTLQVCAPVGENLVCPSTIMTYGPFVQLEVTLAPYGVSGSFGSSTQGETITFYNNGTSVGTATLDQYGNASLTLNEPNAGSYSFTASYPGDSNFNSSSTASGAPLTVQKATSGMSMTVSPQPTASYGTAVFLNARFSPYQGTSDTTNGETVTFYNNGTAVGTATLEGENAQLTLSDLAVGLYNFTVSYPGDGNFTSSNSNSAPQSLSVQKASTLLGVMASPGDVTTYGGPIFLQAHLSPSSEPGGNSTDGESITFLDNGNPIGTGTLSNGNASLNDPLPSTGGHLFAASFAGDASFASSNAVASGAVLVEHDSTTIGINTTSPSTIGSGQSVPLTAQLNPYAVAGGASTDGESVTFLDNGSPIGTGTLSSGAASWQVNNVTQGTHTYAVSYAGDDYFAPSGPSNLITINVLPPTTLTVTTNPVNYATPDQAFSITATLSPYIIDGRSTNGESIYFFFNGNQLGSATLSNGVATLTEPNGLITAGSYSFTAQYLSDGFLSPATSSPLPFLVATTEAFVVNTAADDTDSASYCSPQPQTTQNTLDSACTLRDALLAAAAAPEGATITFDNTVFTAANLISNPSANTINLTQDTLTVPSNTSITGPTSGSGATLTDLVTVNGGGSTNPGAQTFTDFTVTGTNAAINNLIITGGYPIWNNGNPFPGGGIVNSGSLTVTYSEVTNNGSLASGGGIYNTGTLTIIGSTIDNNQSGWNGPGNGGGIDNEDNGTLTIINSTIANNTSTGQLGGGIHLGSGTLSLTNSTISGNRGDGGGIYNSGGTVTLANSIVSGNFRAYYSDIAGTTTYTDKGGNIVGYLGDNTSPTEVNDPRLLNLDALGFYGGPTPTMVPLPGSSVICVATYANSPSTWSTNQIDIDQRGFPNYNLHYGQLGNTGGPLPSVCYDAGAVQTNYTAVQFAPTSYSAVAGSPTTSPVVVSVIENGQSLGGVPITLSYSGAGNLSGNTGTTAQGAGLTLNSLSVDTGGSGNLSTKIVIAGNSYISGSASLTVEAPVQINPGAETFTGVYERSFSQGFTVAGGSGSYQLSSSGTLPSGVTLTPSGTTTGSSWTLSGTPTQSGNFSFTLTATDASNNSLTSSQSFTLNVLAPIQVTPAGETLSAATGTPFSQVFTISGGSGNFQYFNSGTLPNGLTLTQSGSGWTLSGTPTQTGTFPFALDPIDQSVNAWDSYQQYTLVVTSPVSAVTLIAAPAASAVFGQTVTLRATVSSSTATGTVTFYDNGNPLGPGAIRLGGTTSKSAALALDAATLGAPLAVGAHSFTAQYSGDAADAPGTSNTLAINVRWPNYVVNTTSDNVGSPNCTALTSTTSNKTDGNNGGNPGVCTLRAALNAASAVGGGNIYFDATVFAASHLAGNPTANTIYVDVPDNGSSLNIASNTTIQGLTSGTGAKLVNLVTVDGGGTGVSGNGTIFVVGGTGNAINNLNVNNGFAEGGNGGAITNFGAITISGSSFAGNQATQSGGGIFNIVGPLTIINSTFYGNSATGGNGGAIDDTSYSGCGTATVINSTFYQNTATNGGGGLGGAINNDAGGCSLTVVNSTIAGNSTDNSGVSGGGIFNGSTLSLANSIVSANTNGSGGDDLSDGGIGGNFFDGTNVVNGNLIGAYDGNPANGVTPGLSAYGSYGGPMHTMIPLPGSAAICAGSASLTSSAGVTADQRGVALNAGGYCPSGTVDAGAVQTDYSLSFTAQPSNVPQNMTMSPGPAVTLNENGTRFKVAAATVPLSLTSNPAGATLTGGSAATNSGIANYSGIMVNEAGTGDQLTATLNLNPTVTPTAPTLTALSTTFNVTAAPFGAANRPLDAVTNSATVTQGDSVLVTGWAADVHDGAPVHQVSILIDGTAAGNATLGIARPATAAKYGSAYLDSGWTYTYSGNLTATTHTMTVVLYDSLGLSTQLPTHTFTVSSAPAPPYGAVTQAADAITKTTPVGQNDGLLLTGWAADLVQGAPVSQVTVFVDGTSVGNATLGVAGPSGEPANSGWTFTDSTLPTGTHTVSVVAYDSGGRSTTLGSRTITVQANAPPFGAMGLPEDAVTRSTTVTVGDHVLVTGWAADVQDGAPVSQVAIYIDCTTSIAACTPAGTATLGIAQPGIATQYGSRYLNSGWTYTYAGSLAAGSHSMTVVLYDSLGLSTQLPTRTFTVSSAPAPPFGAMNAPQDAVTKSTTVTLGDSVLATGWAADLQDGAPVSQVAIYIDCTTSIAACTPAGTATLHVKQSGVATQYGSRYLYSGWTYTYAGTLAAGTHTVTAVFYDSLSLSTQLPAKTFTVTP